MSSKMIAMRADLHKAKERQRSGQKGAVCDAHYINIYDQAIHFSEENLKLKKEAAVRETAHAAEMKALLKRLGVANAERDIAESRLAVRESGPINWRVERAADEADSQ